VTGIDLAERMLDLARSKAAARGLTNVEFRVGDILDPRLSSSEFDAVICVFGIFFVADMVAALRSLWRLVRTGGQLAITTWGPRCLEPGASAFWSAVREVRPDLYKGFNPWDRISDPPSVRALLSDAGIDEADVIAESGQHSIPSPEAWWAAVLGSGLRGSLDQLDDQSREYVRIANLNYIRDSAVHSVEANVVYATATKPHGSPG